MGATMPGDELTPNPQNTETEIKAEAAEPLTDHQLLALSVVNLCKAVRKCQVTDSTIGGNLRQAEECAWRILPRWMLDEVPAE